LFKEIGHGKFSKNNCAIHHPMNLFEKIVNIYHAIYMKNEW
jgi:hypothetical protein